MPLHLANARDISLGWANLLGNKARQATEHDVRISLHLRAVEIALICVSSFDVDDGILESVLASPKNASIFIQCSIIIQESTKTLLTAADPFDLLLYWRWQRLCYRSHRVLAREIVDTRSDALDIAISKAWSAYRAHGSWQFLSEKGDNWLASQTAPEEDGYGQLQVCYNLLTGELLVNGVPLDRLPAEYERHPMYRRLFGASTIEVMPTVVPGMGFSGKSDYAGHQLHFGICHSRADSSSSDLLLRAIKGHQTWELIPPRALRGMFPTTFIDQFVHWYDVANDRVEFRPSDDPWNSSPQNWIMIRARSGQWKLTRGGAFLVNVGSTTAKVLAGVLSPLEDAFWIHGVFDECSRVLRLELPRLRLDFSLDAGGSAIKSRQFRGMTIDTDQSIGTLVGLNNKLVLKNEQRQSQRMILVPEGRISHKKGHQNHMCVTIDKNSVTKVHAYHVNDLLCKVVDDGSLQSKLLLCYLHALTSFCLPDPLLQKTGTEQALSILNSAAVRSSDQLARDHIDMLHRIALLTPGRRCYPEHERVMQDVSWDAHLGFLAQHGGFYGAVGSIFDRARQSKFFYSESYIEPPSLEKVDQELLYRDNIRSSTFRISGFGGESHTVQHDAVYLARDRGQNSVGASRVYATSVTILQGRSTLHCEFPPNPMAHIWSYLSKSDEILGPSHQLQASEVTYDAQLLLDSFSFISRNWSSLQEMISQQSPRLDKFKLMIFLFTLAFAKDLDMTVIQVLCLFYTVPGMTQINTPPVPWFVLSEGAEVNNSDLSMAIASATVPFNRSPEAKLTQKSWESMIQFNQHRENQFEVNKKAASRKFAKALKVQWPCECPDWPADDGWANYIDVVEALPGIRQKFKSWFDNYQFLKYLTKITDIIPRKTVPVEMPASSLTITEWDLSRKPGFVSFHDIFTCPPPIVPSCNTSNLTWLLSSAQEHSEQPRRLAELMGRLEAKAESSYEHRYVENLGDSLHSLQERKGGYRLRSLGSSLKDVLAHYLAHCKENTRGIYLVMLEAVTGDRNMRLESFTPVCKAVPDVHQWPRLSRVFFLQCLSRERWKMLSKGWKDCIISYGIALTKLQQAERLVSSGDNDPNLINELQNPGHMNWDPHDHPESLLLEIENGMMIREVQEQVASQMRSPATGRNAVMQLNMGEGKSSVIVPIVAASLADGSRLVRVIVAKAQAEQMFQMLVSKLGGLLDRPVFRMPFSRAVKLGEAEAEAIHRIYQDCMATGGILLVQPEHILSFKLMGIECIISGKEAIGRSLLRSQEFLNTMSRDIVDESDENFSVKFELVYTMGTPRPIDHSPERWSCIQQVLSVFRRAVLIVYKERPDSVEMCAGPSGSFPRTRILRQDAQAQVLARVAEHVCKFGLDGFHIARQAESVRQAVHKYITAPELSPNEIKQIEKQSPDGFWADTSKTLLLLRGLLAGGVLAFAFGQKRWRVDYGLDLKRRPQTRLAVPYRAKDNPAARSEFSHSDVVIVLTSLSYYYGGLEDDNLYLAFDHLMKSDQADLEYQLWVKDADELPFAFQQLSGINLEDHFQCIEQIFPCLRYAKSTVDYFLAHIVFPKEMKEFPLKLSTSGWDIGEIKAHPTTGFSGTNDSRDTLPLDMKQIDLAEQQHTNALVLEYLLQPENSVALIRSDRIHAALSDAKKLLDMVVKMDPPVRVILDVGAQILELDNIGVAQQWLKMLPDNEKTQAVVLFDSSDQMCVLDRKGRVEPFQTSPFAAQPDVCLVFLDEVHTRGTDLKLPEDYRAAVTLGPGLTKDKLIQACMRMRRLGKGQSVIFCVPEEIEAKIQAHGSEPGRSAVDVSDVLLWAISESWLDIQRSMPLWAAQGQRHRRHHTLWRTARRDDHVDRMSKSLADQFLEDEAQTIDDRYRPRSIIKASHHIEAAKSEEPDPIVERCREFNALELTKVSLREEQERELSPEVEQERQIQKPAPAEPATHRVHPDIQAFISTGLLINGSEAYMPAFESLSETSAATFCDVAKFPCYPLVTTDFARTIEATGPSYVSDSYQRSVQWVLMSCRAPSENVPIKQLLIISPHEAQELLPRIIQSKTVTLHLYAPRPNLGFRPLDSLDLYPIPRQPESPIDRPLVIMLNLFAGQLYFRSFMEYGEACDQLGLSWRQSDKDGVLSDGFIWRNRFFKILLTKIRRNCDCSTCRISEHWIRLFGVGGLIAKTLFT